MIRAFIAIELPEEVRAALARVQARLKEAISGGVRWVDPGGIHLTLKFLGPVAPERMEAIGQAVARAAGGVAPFPVEVAGLGGFPSLGAPRVLWVGLQAPGELARLQRLLEGEIVPLGFPPEARPFSPHLTLGRVREGLAAPERRRLGEAARALGVGSLGAFSASGVSLMQSTLTPTGAIYRRLGAFPLGG